MTYAVSARPRHSYQMQVPEQPKHGTEKYFYAVGFRFGKFVYQWLHWGRCVPRDGDKREPKNEAGSPVQLVLEKI